ncbi:hypothetical protein NQZ68_012111 [Dissostichus eleginoides]|nr:hypothetical protein NQZ68_012111 [Dissostichus eleginoides]
MEAKAISSTGQQEAEEGAATGGTFHGESGKQEVSCDNVLREPEAARREGDIDYLAHKMDFVMFRVNIKCGKICD